VSEFLRRHDLVRLTRAGWARLQRALPRHRIVFERWSERDHPLVIARHRGPASTDRWSAGLPVPLAHERLRIAVDLMRADIAHRCAFPRAARVLTLPLALRDGLHDLSVRVYGAHGWQALTGEEYVHRDSDIDLLVDVVDEHHADSVAARLAALASWPLDGELVFADGRAVAWREWIAWRAGRTAQVLVKRIDAVTIETEVFA